MNLRELDHLRAEPMIRFKEEVVEGRTYTIVSYMISTPELWRQPKAEECRGNTYDTLTGECVSACFPKFFNVGECPGLAQHEIKTQVQECYEKRDGSMVTPILTANGHIRLKTKKSFYSEVAELANASMHPGVLELCEEMCAHQLTPIFEFTSPQNRIVLSYGDTPVFVLLALRDNLTGTFASYEELQQITRHYSVNLIPRLPYSWDQISDSVKNDTGIEGYVLLLNSGVRVKFKTDWYISMHHTMTDLRERDVAKCVIDETLDDLKALVASQGQSIEPLCLVEAKVRNQLALIRTEVETEANKFRGMAFKYAAMALKGNPYFSLIMAELRGMEPKYIEYWQRNYLSEVPLTCLYNRNF